MRPPSHTRLGKLLGMVGPLAALLCTGYFAFARWQHAKAPGASRGGIPPRVLGGTRGQGSAAEPPPASAVTDRFERKSSLLDNPDSTVGRTPRSRTAHLESLPPGRPATEPDPDPGEALAAAGNQEALSTEGSLQAREGEPSSPGLVLVASSGRFGAEGGPVPDDLPAPAPATSRSISGGGARAFSPQSPRSNSRIWMAPRTANVKVGDRIAVRVEIAQAVDVASVPFHVLFNPAVLRFEGAAEGAFLKGAGRDTVFLAAPAAGGNNEVAVGLARLGSGAGNDGSGELCVLNFTVIGGGDAGLAFSRARLVDSQSQIVPSRFVAASITAH